MRLGGPRRSRWRNVTATTNGSRRVKKRRKSTSGSFARRTGGRAQGLGFSRSTGFEQMRATLPARRVRFLAPCVVTQPQDPNLATNGVQLSGPAPSQGSPSAPRSRRAAQRPAPYPLAKTAASSGSLSPSQGSQACPKPRGETERSQGSSLGPMHFHPSTPLSVRSWRQRGSRKGSYGE